MSHLIRFAILFLMLVTNVVGFHEKDTDEEAFEKFKKDVKKGDKYKTSDEEKQAFKYFKENRKNIIAHNKKHDQGQAAYRLTINDRMDWSPEKMKKVNNYVPPTDKEMNNMAQHTPRRRKPRATGPILGYSPFDWRDKGAVPPIRDQGGCGTCGLCAKTDAVASQLAIKNNTTAVPLSVQAVVDCDYGNLTLQPALDTPIFIMNNGIPTEADYPYMAGSSSYCVEPYDRDLTGYQGSCEMWNKTLVQPFVDRNRNSWGVCAGCNPKSETAMVDGIINGGPLVVGIASSCLGFNYYGSGIVYKSNCTNGVDHAVVLVGVGVQTVVSISSNFTCQMEQVPYYIVKNSWGTGWGQNGYGKVAVGYNEIKLGSGGTYAALTNPEPPLPTDFVECKANTTCGDMPDSTVPLNTTTFEDCKTKCRTDQKCVTTDVYGSVCEFYTFKCSNYFTYGSNALCSKIALG